MKLTGFHLEPTNRCVLACSACERTQFIDRFGRKAWHNQDLDLQALQQFMDLDITNLTWGICGNTGDPIYYEHLRDLIMFIKSHQGRIVLTTNGSYRDTAWWETWVGMLTPADIVEFSVDGLPETSTQYRVNSDWNTIEQGIRAVVSCGARAVWKVVPFSFNEHQIPDIQAQARALGMHDVKLDPSNRFADSDPLRPKSQSLIWHRGQGLINPKCATGNQHYISASGYYAPCCYAADHRFHYRSQFHQDPAAYDISNTRLSQVLAKLSGYDEQMRIDPQPVCSYTCRKL